MKRCKLRNTKARETVAAVWRHLRKHHSTDARFLAAIVIQIKPLTKAEAVTGTVGRWVHGPSCQNFSLGSIESRTWFDRLERLYNGDDHGDGYGTIRLLDCAQLSAGTVAHEMGHAFTSFEDMFATGAPDDEWAREAAADMHAVRWGLMTLDDIQKRYTENVAGAEKLGPTFGPAWAHHGPPPGGDWFEYDGVRLRLNKNFVFERVDA